MQVTQADTNSCKRVGVEEHLIKFKPSPNFKNMKKFIKSRSETITMETPVSVAPGAPDLSPPPSHSRPDNERIPAWHEPEFQPPLPLEPPPPDYIPNVQVKQEVVNTEYETNQPAPIQENQDQERNPDPMNDHSTVICRDFIRGTCKREGTCKYAHRHDLSQLEGVYTFCRKFQNSVCTFPNCKYVHATVFEEQHFYRTGFLPDHALHHKWNSNTLQPPPPPPPEEPPAMPLNVDFTNPPPTFCNELEKPMISCIPASSMEARGYYMGDIQNPMPSTSRSPVKRTWSNMEASVSAPPCDHACNENELSKKCKFCDITEYRLEHTKNKLKKALQSKEERNKKMAVLDKQSEKLRSLITELLPPAVPARPQPQTNSNISGDKDKLELLDALNRFFSANSTKSSFGENK